MALDAGKATLGATTSRPGNKLAYDVANKLPANATVAANDVVITFDTSLDYKASYSLVSDIILASGGGTAGTVAASKAVVVDANKDISSFRNVGITGTLTWSGATGVNLIALTDNLASALDITEGANSYLKFTTTDSSESITVGKATTFSGVVTQSVGSLNRMRRNAPVAAAGSVLADAAQLLEGFTVVTGANGTLGVKLPATPVAGTMVWIKGTTSGVLKVWPDAAATINAIGSNGALSMTTGAMPMIFIADSATQWYTIPLVAS